MNSLKLLIKGSSTHGLEIRLCDIPGLVSPVTVSILSATLTNVKVEDIEKKKYEKDVQAIQDGLREAEEKALIRGALLSGPSAPLPVAHAPQNPPLGFPMEPNPAHPPSGHVSLQLPLFSAAFLSSGNPPSELSNHVVLPTSCLQQFTQEAVDFPIVLELSRTSTAGETRKTHVIPIDYQNRITAAYAPYHVLEDLGLFSSLSSSTSNQSAPVENSSTAMDVDAPSSESATNHASSPYPTSGEGTLVTFKTVKLPKGTMATIQPQEFEWMSAIGEEQQKPVLENQLRQFQCLSVHDTVRIQHQNRTFTFKVVSLEPAPAVSLLGTDLAVEILPASNAPSHVDLTPLLQLHADVPTDFKSETQMVLNLKKGDSRYFSLELQNPNLALAFEIESLEGFPASLFAATHRPYPSPMDHTWTSDDFTQLSQRQATLLQQTGKRRLLLSQDDPSFATGRFHVSVVAHMADASCIFRAQVGLKSDLALWAKSSNMLGSSGEPPANSTQCSHCSRWVPNASSALHQIQCVKRNWVCPKCHFVCPTTEKDKHLSIAHTLITCECGFQSEGDLVALHREYECHLRPSTCPYCNLAMPQGERAAHMRDCGSRTSQCDLCHEWIKNYDMTVHRFEAHSEDQHSSSAP